VVYAIDGVVPEQYQALYRLNPMTSSVQGLRWAVFGTGDPPGPALLVSFVIVTLALGLSAVWFRRRERSIVDIL
jgi:ABC-type polysaccharide/polyol phosphate export permease